MLRCNIVFRSSYYNITHYDICQQKHICINWQNSTKGGGNLLHNIYSRTKALGLNSNDIIRKLDEQGLKCQPCTYSSAINGNLTSPKARQIVQMADEIIKKLEAERKKK